MSDDEATKTDPSPQAEAPLEDEHTPAETPRSIAGLPIDMFVKGGTTTDTWDREQQRFDAETDARQAHQDQQREIVDQVNIEGGGIASLQSLNFNSRANPKVVIEYCYRDSVLNQECLCEIFTQPDESDPTKVVMGLVLVCPKCLRRTGKQWRSQTMIRSHIREFWLRPSTDPDFPEDKRVWVNYVDGSVHQIAGTITTRDAISCNALGCNWRFRIDESKLREV